MPGFFYVEMTDTFGGEANYSWVRRFKVSAETMRGAINKFSRESGLSWRCAGNYGDQKRYDSVSGCTCCFIESFDTDSHGGYTLAEI